MNFELRFDSTPLLPQISIRPVTTFLQRLYLRRTSFPGRPCSMRRCERQLTVVTPALAMKFKRTCLCLLLPASLMTQVSVAEPGDRKSADPSPHSDLIIRQIVYDGKLSDEEARFAVELSVESKSKQ